MEKKHRGQGKGRAPKSLISTEMLRLTTIIDNLAAFNPILKDNSFGYIAFPRMIDMTFYEKGAMIKDSQLPDYIKKYICAYFERKGAMATDRMDSLLLMPQVYAVADAIAVYEIVRERGWITVNDLLDRMTEYLTDELDQAGFNMDEETVQDCISGKNRTKLAHTVKKRTDIILRIAGELEKMKLLELDKTSDFISAVELPREYFDAYVNLNGEFRANDII